MSTKSGLFTIYTLTSTHCGTGQAAGAVDLPIAREGHTQLPVLPATTLKGVARDAFERAGLSKEVKDLFGPEIKNGATEEGHRAGALVFCEGRLLAYPARSLHRPFFYATSRLVLERLERDLRAFGLDTLAAKVKLPAAEGALVGDKELAGKALVIEDLVYEGADVRLVPEIGAIGELLCGWLPGKEEATKRRLARSLVLLPDDDFLSLVQRAVPVQARIALTAGKTTDKFVDDQGREEKGNLWYEEALPADCLFASFVTERAQRHQSEDGGGAKSGPGLKDLLDNARLLASVQIGGNETVGQGRCWWNAVQEGASR